MQANLIGLYRVLHPRPLYIQPHVHASHELIYYLRGQGSVVLGDRQCDYGAGDICISRRGTLHDENNFEESLRIFLFFDAPEHLALEGFYRDQGLIRPILRRLQHEASEPMLCQRDMQDSLLTQLLVEIYRLSARQQPKMQNWARVLEYVDEHYCDDLDFVSLAAQLHCSYDRFRHIFKERTGLSPGAYVTGKRVETAKMLIACDVSIPLTRIAYDCGFSSSPQFSNAFRAKTGLSPSAYRQACIAGDGAV